jgi:hypothetical protein
MDEEVGIASVLDESFTGRSITRINHRCSPRRFTAHVDSERAHVAMFDGERRDLELADRSRVVFVWERNEVELELFAARQINDVDKPLGDVERLLRGVDAKRMFATMLEAFDIDVESERGETIEMVGMAVGNHNI